MNFSCGSGTGLGILYRWLWPCYIRSVSYRWPLHPLQVKNFTLESRKGPAVSKDLHPCEAILTAVLMCFLLLPEHSVVVFFVTVSSILLSTSSCKASRKIRCCSVIYFKSLNISFVFEYVEPEFREECERRNTQIIWATFSKNNLPVYLHWLWSIH